MSETKKTTGKEKTAQATTTPVTAAPVPQKEETVVYIGPDIPGAKQYTTYNAGLPDALKEKIKEHPFFNSLIVPVERLAKANAELEQKGSALSALYQRACEKKEGKET